MQKLVSPAVCRCGMTQFTATFLAYFQQCLCFSVSRTLLNCSMCPIILHAGVSSIFISYSDYLLSTYTDTLEFCVMIFEHCDLAGPYSEFQWGVCVCVYLSELSVYETRCTKKGSHSSSPV